MGQHRAVRRLGVVLALPVALLLVPLIIFIAASKASADPANVNVSGSASCDTATGQWQVTWSINADPLPEGWASRNFVVTNPQPVGPGSSVNPGVGVSFATTTVTQTLPVGNPGGFAQITLTAHYLDDVGVDHPIAGNVGSPTFSGTCPSAPPPTTAVTTTKPPTTKPPTTRPPTTSSAPVIVTTAVTTSASPTTSDVLVVGTDTETTQQQASDGDDGGGTPSFLLLIATFLILLGFLIALIFLIRERRALKRDRDDEDDGYWDEYRADYR